MELFTVMFYLYHIRAITPHTYTHVLYHVIALRFDTNEHNLSVEVREKQNERERERENMQAKDARE